MLVLAGSVFIATQLIMIYRPAGEAVAISSPFADEWLVGQGGHAELVNYHYVTRLSVTHLTFCRSRTAAPTSREVPS